MSTSKVLETVQLYGIPSSSVPDLLAVGFSRQPSDVDQTRDQVALFLRKFPGVESLRHVTPDDLTRHFGFTHFEIDRVQSLLEIGNRMAKVGAGEDLVLNTPDRCYDQVKELAKEKQEHFVVILVDSKLKLIRKSLVHIGTLTEIHVGVKEVFREAVRDGAYGIILSHNHPSGDPEPSPQDGVMTAKLQEAGTLLGIEVCDHIIVGRNSYYSFRARGRM